MVGQDNLLSRSVQGHIGEEVGKVVLKGGKPFCESDFRPQKGDGFKILRGGREVGGAVPAGGGKGGFYLHADARLLGGDTVCVTTDGASSSRVLQGKRTRKIELHLRLFAGEFPKITWMGWEFIGETRLESAKNAPLDEAQVSASFERTDGLPFTPAVTLETDGVFLPRSALNSLRRAFYAALCERIDPKRTVGEAVFEVPQLPPAKTKKCALIARNVGNADINIVKPSDYSRLPSGGKGVYLYLPPLFTEADETLLAPRFKDFEGIYCEGDYGLSLAEKYGVKLFAGTGFNLTNRYAVAAILRHGVEFFALSKEISAAEQAALDTEGAFALCEGAIKVMDLCYCPFEKNCSSCDRREFYTLTDAEGRKFPLRRYVLNGCRFEVYNCAPLLCDLGAARLTDRSAEPKGEPTRGHSIRSMV